MGRLEYDDNGFAYFGFGLGVSILVPVTLSVAWGVARVALGWADEGQVKSSKARSAAEQRKLQQAQQESGVRKMMTRDFLIKCGIIMIGWIVVLYLYSFTGRGDGDIVQFDPWEIIGLPETSGHFDNPEVLKKIKSSYRKLSLMYHPDRNVAKDITEQTKSRLMFERIQKAHEILTEKAAFDLFATTGSPDGSKNMEVSIGLPKFLMEKTNHNMVLVVYLLFLVVVTPIAVGSWYSNSKMYGDRLILNDTYNLFSFLIDKSLKLEHMPEVLALSAEFRQLPPRSEQEEEALAALEQRMKSEGLMPRELLPKVSQRKFFQRWPGCARANILLYAYLNRLTDDLSSGLMEDLEFILRKSKMLVDAMNETTTYSRNVQQISAAFKFEQYLTQALWLKDSPYMQLPHVGRAQVADAMLSAASIKRTLATPERLALLTKNLTAAEIKDVNAVAKLLPNITVDITIGTVSEERQDGTLLFDSKACEGDILTASIEVTRDHLEGPVHAPYLPYDKEEQWTVMFCKKGDSQVLSQVKIAGKGRVLREKMVFPSKNFVAVGESSFDFHVLSYNYVGFDVLAKGTVELFPEGTVKPPPLHPEDEALDKVLTPFQEMMGTQAVSDDSDFGASSDEEGSEGKQGIARKKASSKDDLVADEDGEEPKKEK